MNPAITLLAVMAMLTIMWAEAAVYQNEPWCPRCPTVFDQAMYGSITDGMTISEVQRLVGAQPTERECIWGITKTNTHVEVVTWTDATNQTLNVVFYNGRSRSGD